MQVRSLEEMGVAHFEEPLPQYDFPRTQAGRGRAGLSRLDRRPPDGNAET